MDQKVKIFLHQGSKSHGLDGKPFLLRAPYCSLARTEKKETNELVKNFAEIETQGAHILLNPTKIRWLKLIK